MSPLKVTGIVCQWRKKESSWILAPLDRGASLSLRWYSGKPLTRWPQAHGNLLLLCQHHCCGKQNLGKLNLEKGSCWSMLVPCLENPEWILRIILRKSSHTTFGLFVETQTKSGKEAVAAISKGKFLPSWLTDRRTKDDVMELWHPSCIVDWFFQLIW